MTAELGCGWGAVADEHYCGVGLVGGALERAVVAFFCDADGGEIFGVDDAGGARSREVRVTPGDGGADGFGGVAFAACLRGEGPACFRDASERLQVALVVGEANFSDEISGCFFFDDPITET